MNIAICQLQIKYEDKQENLRRAEKFIKKASEKNAELILFPEMSFTGFSMNTALIGEENETIKTIQRLAKQYDIAIGFGWVAHKENSENHYTVIDKDSEILGDYIKIHPFTYAGEDKHFVGGTDLCSFSYKDIQIGLSICYDLRFPELYQKLSENADVILVPANWPAKRTEHWKALLKARAIENQAYIIGINCVGRQQFTKYIGNSQIINPNGDIITKCGKHECMNVITLENDVEIYRKSFPTKKDRKKEIYKGFYNN